MARQNRIEIIINADDQASPKIGKIKGAFGGLKTALGGLASAAAVGFGAVIAGAAGAAAGILKLAKDAAPLEGIEKAFAGIAEAGGKSMDTMLAALQEGSAGMVSQRDLMATYNNAAQLVSTTFANQLPDAMQYLRKVSAATGEDMGFMLNSLVTGVGRLSPMILDNLKIQVSLADATARASEMFGVEAGELTKTQTQAGMMNVVLEKLAENTASMPDVTGTATHGMASFAASIKDIKAGIGKAFLPILNELMIVLGDLAEEYGPKVIEWARIFSEWLRIRLIPQVMDFGKKTITFISEIVIPTFKRIISAVPWDEIIDTLGIVTGAVVAIGGAVVNTIAKIPGLRGLVDAIPTGEMVVSTAQVTQGLEDITAKAAGMGPVLVDEFRTGGAALWEFGDKAAGMGKALEDGFRTGGAALWEFGDKAAGVVEIDWAKADADVELLAKHLSGMGEAMWELNETAPETQTVWQTLGGVVRDDVLPHLGTWGELFGVIWGKGVELDILLKGRVRNAIRTGLTDPIGRFLNNQGKRFGEMIDGWVISLRDYFIPKVELLKAAIRKLGESFEWATGWLNRLKDAVSNWNPADAISGNSPSPFEMGIRGIADAAREATAAIGGMQMPGGAFGGMAGIGAGAGAGGGSQRMVVIAPILIDPARYQNVRGDYDYLSIGQLLVDMDKGL